MDYKRKPNFGPSFGSDPDSLETNPRRAWVYDRALVYSGVDG